MNRWTVLTILMMALTACAVPVTPAATGTPEASMPNPASVHCRETGNTLDIRTSTGGSQHGVCVFPDGSECDEWAYFRGECGPTPPAPEATPTVGVPDEPTRPVPPDVTEDVSDWRGVIKKTDAGAQFDDYFERQDLDQPILFGIDSRDPAIEAQIEALRDSGKIVHLYGTLVSDVPDVNGSQILVVSLVVDE